MVENIEVKNGFARRWEDRRKEYLAFERRTANERFHAWNVDSGILTLDIEPTNLCDIRCRMCARTVLGYDRQDNTTLGFMDVGLYRRLIDEAVQLGVVSLRLAWYGEPLLHPEIAAMVSYAKLCGVRDVGFNTNATHLNEEMALKILHSGLDRLVFSIDSPYAEQYERIRLGADFKVVLANIRRFNRLRHKLGCQHLLTRASLVLMKENADAVEDYVALLRDHVDIVATGSFHDFLSTPTCLRVGKRSSFMCPYLWLGMVIGWDGRVYVCSIDANRKCCVGDAKRQSLREIWLGEPYMHIRELHRTHRWQEVTMCGQCNLVDLFLDHYEMPSTG